MAERRMFANAVIGSDDFLDMPTTTQLLYFHLGMRADDDGFVGSPRVIMRMIGASNEDLNLLCAKNYTIRFKSGILLISHWKINNYIQKDRYRETVYTAEKESVKTADNKMYTECIQGVSNLDAQVSIGKISLGKFREGTAAKPPTHTPARRSFSKYGWVKLTEEEHNRLLSELGEQELTRCITYIDEAAESTGNKNHWKNWNLVIRRCSRDGWGKNWTGKQQKKGGFLDESFYMTQESAKDVDDFISFLYGDDEQKKEEAPA